MTPRVAADYKGWRRTESLDREKPLKPKTLKDDMHLYQGFLEHAATLRAVSPDVPSAVKIPSLNRGEGVEHTTLAPERARASLEYLAKFEYASLEHVVLLLFCKTGRRPCDLRALDVVDFDGDGEDYTLEFVHRPETDTPLKEDEAHEAEVTLGETVGDTISEFVEYQRPDVKDQYDRVPLLATKHGRISKSTIKEYSYKWTRPCVINQGCPYDRELDVCEAAQSTKKASKCPDSRSPRPLRSGYITAKLNAGASYEAVGHRVGATKEVLQKHYDHPKRDDERKRHRDEIMNSNSERSGYAN